MSPKHLKTASVVPEDQRAMRREFDPLSGIRQRQTICALFIVCETEPRDEPMTPGVSFKLGPN
jgi:hypothetical protein